MGFLQDLGIPIEEGFFADFFGKGFVVWLGIILLFFVIIIFVGGITFWWNLKKNRKLSYKNQIPIFINTNNKLTSIQLSTCL